MECYRYLRNVHDLQADGQTLHERRFDSPLHGPIIPFGAGVKFYPMSAKYQGRVHQFGTSLSWKFMGYAMNAGGSWTGDLFIAEAEDLKTMPPTEIHVKGVKPKGVHIQKRDDNHA